MKERRKHSRSNKMMALLFYYENDHDIVYSINSKNISAGGCYLIFDQKVPSGTLLNIGVDLNTSQVGAETVKSQILRCEKIKENIYGWAVEFKNMSSKLKQAIIDLVQQNLNTKAYPDDLHYLADHYMWNIKSDY